MPLETTVISRFAGALGAHAQTTRFSYTVPNGKVAIIRHVLIRVFENAAAIPLAQAQSLLLIGASAIGTLYSRNQLGFDSVLALAPALVISGGTTVAFATINNSASNCFYEAVLAVGELN
jgi:hypothetical protein